MKSETGVQWQTFRLLTIVIHIKMIDVVQSLQGLSCKLYANVSLELLAFELFTPVLVDPLLESLRFRNADEDGNV